MTSIYNKLDAEVDEFYPPKHALEYWQKLKEGLLKRIAVIEDKITTLESENDSTNNSR